ISRWYFLTSDYAFGHDLLRVARNLLMATKGTEVGSDLAPTGTTDFSQYITKIKAAKPDLVFHNLAGADVTNFLKQYAEAGMTLEVAGGVIDSAYAWPVGESLGGHFPIIWWHELATPASHAWAARFVKRWGRPPDNQAYGGYVAGHAIAQAVDRGKSTDSARLVEALAGHTPPAAAPLVPHRVRPDRARAGRSLRPDGARPVDHLRHDRRHQLRARRALHARRLRRLPGEGRPRVPRDARRVAPARGRPRHAHR